MQAERPPITRPNCETLTELPKQRCALAGSITYLGAVAELSPLETKIACPVLLLAVKRTAEKCIIMGPERTRSCLFL